MASNLFEELVTTYHPYDTNLNAGAEVTRVGLEMQTENPIFDKSLFPYTRSLYATLSSVQATIRERLSNYALTAQFWVLVKIHLKATLIWNFIPDST